MLLRGTGFYIWVILGIVWTVACLVECVILMPKRQTSNMSLQGQSNMSGIYVLDDHNHFFPPVSLDVYFAKSIIAVKNTIQHPVMAHNICLPSPWLSNLYTSRPGFSVLHPYHMASLNGSYPSKSLFIENASFGLVVKRDLNFEQANGISISILSIVTVVAAVLIFLVFMLIMSQIIPSHSVDYSIKGEKRSIQVVRPKQKSSAVHLSQRNRKSGKSTKMAHFKSVQRDESSFSPSLVSNKPVIIDSNGGKFEESPPVSSTVRTRKDKKKRPRKKNGVTSGIIAHMEVLNYNENSLTPNCPSSEQILFNDSSSLFIRDTIVTFPGLERSALDPPISTASKLAICSLSRAPGARSKSQKAVQTEDRGDYEDRFRYDIWGDHFSRIGLMFRPDGSFASLSEPMEGVSHSFFVSDPLQTLMRNSSPAPVTVSLSMEQL